MEATFSPSYCLEKKHKMKGKERNQKTIEQQTFPENKPNSVKISKDPRKRKPESQMKREKKKSWCVDQGRSRLFFVATPSPPFHLTLTLRLAKGIENHRPSLSLSLLSPSLFMIYKASDPFFELLLWSTPPFSSIKEERNKVNMVAEQPCPPHPKLALSAQKFQNTIIIR